MTSEHPYLELAGIGAWSVDLATGEIRWSRLTRALHELETEETPAVEEALTFYPEPGRSRLRAALERSQRDGSPWDLDLPFVTARGRERIVRVHGRVVRRGDRPVALYGTIEDITERVAEQREHERLALVVRQMTNPVIITDAEGRAVWANRAFEEVTGYRVEELLGRTPGSVLQGPGTDPATVAVMRDAVRKGRSFEVEVVNHRRDGTPYRIAIAATALRDAEGRLTGFIAVEQDVTARHAAEEAARAELARRLDAETMLREVIETLPSGVYVADRRERIVLYNRAYAEAFPKLAPLLAAGSSVEALIRAGVATASYGDEIDPAAPEAEREAWVQRLLATIRGAGPDSRSREVPLGGGRWVQARERRSPSGYLVCVRTDITRLKQAEEEARRLAEEDPLTGLANRRRFFAALERALAGRRQRDRAGGCVALFDLDHFKAINDGLGHEAGDRLLVELARRLRAATRAGDTVARLGGDEFALLLPGLPEESAGLERLERLLGELSAPVDLGGTHFHPSISIGAAFYPRDGMRADDLYRAADSALYAAKQGGRGRVRGFDPGLLARRAEPRRIERLREAIHAGRLGVALQPQVALGSGRVVGIEALARWTDQGRAVPPGEFVALAEESGLARDLGDAVLRAALGALRRLLDAGLDPGRLAVNFGTAQLLAPDAPDRLLALAEQAGVPPERLEVEITEHALIDRSAERIDATLRRLTAAGVQVALDDFGTGHASLKHLLCFPIHRLKIDRSFTEAMCGDERAATLVRAMIGLARGLGLGVVAEGVETEAQRARLEAKGCEAIQGALVAMPLPLEALARWLRAYEKASGRGLAGPGALGRERAGRRLRAWGGAGGEPAGQACKARGSG